MSTWMRSLSGFTAPLKSAGASCLNFSAQAAGLISVGLVAGASGATGLRRFFARDHEQAVELFIGHALEHAEVRARQRRALEVVQQAGAVAALLLFEFAARVVAGAAPGELVARDAAVLVGDLARRLPVEVEALLAVRDREQVLRAAGVAAEEGRQRLLREGAGRALLNVHLDAQFQRLRRAREQRGRELPELAHALGRAHLGTRRRRGDNGWFGGCGRRGRRIRQRRHVGVRRRQGFSR